MKILLVEDEILIQRTLKRLLEKRECQVDVTNSGKVAVKLLSEKKYDRIICDLMLSDTSGFDVLEQSKGFFNRDEMGRLFIIITAYCSTEVLQRAAGYGCRVIQKPFDDIHATIDQFIIDQ